MQRLAEAYFHLLKFIMVLCLVGMVILVFGNVVLRYGFNSGITVSEEVARLFFVYLTFLGAIIAMREHLHLGIDSLVRRLPAGGKRLCVIVSHLLMLGVTWLIMKGSWLQTLINLDVKTPVTGISMAVFYGVGLIFSGSVGLILLYDLYRALAGTMSDAEMVMVKESEDVLELEQLEHARVASAQRDVKLSGVKPT